MSKGRIRRPNPNRNKKRTNVTMMPNAMGLGTDENSLVNEYVKFQTEIAKVNRGIHNLTEDIKQFETQIIERRNRISALRDGGNQFAGSVSLLRRQLVGLGVDLEALDAEIREEVAELAPNQLIAPPAKDLDVEDELDDIEEEEDDDDDEEWEEEPAPVSDKLSRIHRRLQSRK